jgi:hypothetical protein
MPFSWPLSCLRRPLTPLLNFLYRNSEEPSGMGTPLETPKDSASPGLLQDRVKTGELAGQRTLASCESTFLKF